MPSEMKRIFVRVLVLTIAQLPIARSWYRSQTTVGDIPNYRLPSEVLQSIVDRSLELALTSCQESFKWDRWNCPSKDFLAKKSGNHLNREAAYVIALTTAAMIYTITNDCSTGMISGCGCTENWSNQFAKCSDDPSHAMDIIENLIKKSTSKRTTSLAYATAHNDQAVKIIINKSLRRYCRCKTLLGVCVAKECWNSLKPFNEVANDIRAMYNRASLLSNHNSVGSITWKNVVREDSLVYVEDSPNYCKANAITGWNGMRGRQCSRQKGMNISTEEKRSCRNLCRSCGLKIRTQTVVTKRHCNFKFSWCFRLDCDICAEVEKQHYCY